MTKDKNYEDDYSEDDFWKKIKQVAIKAGREIIEEALKLFYVIMNKKTPASAKAVAIAALGYFISPLDAIPDITPVVGGTPTFDSHHCITGYVVGLVLV